MSDEKENEALRALQLVCILNNNLNDALETNEETDGCFMFKSNGFISSIEFLGIQIWLEGDSSPIAESIEDMKKQVKAIMHRLRATADVEELFKAPI